MRFLLKEIASFCPLFTTQRFASFQDDDDDDDDDNNDDEFFVDDDDDDDDFHSVLFYQIQ